MIALDRYGFKVKSTNGYWLKYLFAELSDGSLSILPTHPHMEYAYARAKTICQCTGLKDSEGNLIYENDILEIETPHGKDNGVVYYQELDTSFRVWQEAFTMGLALVKENTKTMDWKIKVIGNKYDKEVKDGKLTEKD